MNWKHATRAQLCEIAYNDQGAKMEHRIAAAEELKRRNRKIANNRSEGDKSGNEQ